MEQKQNQQPKKQFWGVHRFLQLYQILRQFVFATNSTLVIWCLPQQTIWEYEYIQVQVEVVLAVIFNLMYYKVKFLEFNKYKLVKKSAISLTNISLGLWKFVNTLFLVIKTSVLISQVNTYNQHNADFLTFCGLVSTIILVTTMWFQGSQMFEGFEQCITCIKAEQVRRENKKKQYTIKDQQQTQTINDMLQKLKSKQLKPQSVVVDLEDIEKSQV